MAAKKPAAKETQAEKNARIQKELAARGAKIQTKEQIAAQRERASKKQAALAQQPKAAPARNGGTNGGGTMQRRPAEYASGRMFDETTRKALKRSGAE